MILHCKNKATRDVNNDQDRVFFSSSMNLKPLTIVVDIYVKCSVPATTPLSIYVNDTDLGLVYRKWLNLTQGLSEILIKWLAIAMVGHK